MAKINQPTNQPSYQPTNQPTKQARDEKRDQYRGHCEPEGHSDGDDGGGEGGIDRHGRPAAKDDQDGRPQKLGRQAAVEDARAQLLQTDDVSLGHSGRC